MELKVEEPAGTYAIRMNPAPSLDIKNLINFGSATLKAMDPQIELQYLIALTLIAGIGPIKAKNLISWSGGVAEVFRKPKGQLLKVPGIGPETVNLLKSSDTLIRAEKELAWCERNQVKCITYLDEGYPNALKHTFDGPLVLFQKGPARLNQQEGIGIVGTRKATEKGKAIAAEFAGWFAQRGFNVVSGLAYGIDIAAHKGALAAGGLTTAVLGHGLDRVYPSVHKQRAGEIGRSGALLTEFVSGTNPDASNFPARNRILSGLCRAIIVVEAMERGGAQITARFAFDQNREVYAVPGSLFDKASAGCNKLIRDQIAKLITDPQEILDDLNIGTLEAEDNPGRISPIRDYDVVMSSEERKVVKFLERGEGSIEQISEGTGLGQGDLYSMLLGLEFKGVLRQMPGKKFCRV